ncbi:MAG TPA: hypothetical protein QF694_03365 [Dehalococcoidia bacterium]|nr:hypothetical protein [Dehalococcoidia bacterium]HJP27831.1 hypothetical protein [Dehalococcoidia bacterium]
MVKRIGLLVTFSQVVAALFVVGCGDEGLGASLKPALAPTSVPPTFVRIVVTPSPTAR